MTPRIKYIRGRIKQTLPELRGAFVAAAKKATWPKMLGALGILALLLVAVSLLLVRRNFTARHEPVREDITEVSAARHPLTGKVLAEPLTELPQVFGVMIENSYEAWPLSGLDQAFLVIEAPVEGNIPRFIAFFDSAEDSKKIGPVRSARPYYVDWADELGALYAHVGGSPEALDFIKANGVTKDLNEFFQGEYFWRDNVGRFAPHNVYTSTNLLTEAVAEVGKNVREYSPWLFTDGVPGSSAISPTINWESGSTYDVTWKYDPSTNVYTRFQGTVPMKLSSGASVVSNNVIVLETDITVVDNLGRRHLRTTGDGEAKFYTNGEALFVRWSKPTRTDRLRFFGEEGKEIELNAGKTWIEVIGDLTNVAESAPKSPEVSVTGQE